MFFVIARYGQNFHANVSYGAISWMAGYCLSSHRFPAATVQFRSSGIRVASTPLGGPIDCIFVALAYGNDQDDQSAILNFVDEAVADAA